tara:strand:- start:2634 stop:2822 length:189 start_codon:yes stop_codon:yes gene_type:complete
MNTFILILTLSSWATSGSSIGAGIATAEFSSEERCKSAAKAWIESRPNNQNKNDHSAICVPK